MKGNKTKRCKFCGKKLNRKVITHDDRGTVIIRGDFGKGSVDVKLTEPPVCGSCVNEAIRFLRVA